MILDDAGLVVDVHERHQHRLGRERRRHLRRIERTVSARSEVGDAPPAPLELAARIEHRLVLGARRDDVPPGAAVIVGDAEDGEVVRLGRSRGPHDVGGLRTDRRGDLGTRGLRPARSRVRRIRGSWSRDCRTRPRASGTRAMRAATARRDRRGRGVIEVHAARRSFAAPAQAAPPLHGAEMPRRILSSFRSSCARLKSRRSRSIK